MRVVWTTSPGADPRLRRVLQGVRGDAVVSAMVDDVPVYVTAIDGHYDGDCPRPGSHDCAATAVRVWDAASGELVRTVADVGGAHLAAAVVDGRPVAVACDWSSTPKLIDLESGVILDEIAGHRDIVQGSAITVLEEGPAVVTVGWDETIRVMQLTTGETSQISAGERLDAVAVVAVEGRPVAVVAGETVGLWDLERGVLIGSLPLASRMRKIATWPDCGALVALLSWEGEVQVWDAASGRRLSCRMPGRCWSQDIAGVVTDDGRRLVVLSDHEAVHLRDLDGDRPAGPPLVGPTSWCAVTGDGPGVVVTASPFDDAVGFWRVGSDFHEPDTGHTSAIGCLAAGPGGHLFAGGTDGTIGSWRLEDGRREPVIGALNGPVRAVAEVPVGNGVVVLAGGGDLHTTTDDSLHRWLEGGPDRPVVVGHRGEVRILRITVLDGRPIVLTAGCDGSVRITDVMNGDHFGDFPGRYPPEGIAVGDLGGRRVVAVSRNFDPFQLWDLAGGVAMMTPVTEAMDIGEHVHAFVHTGEEPAILTVHSHLVRIRDLDTGTTRVLEPDNSEPVAALAVQDSGNHLAAVARVDASVSVIDLLTRTVVDTFTLPYPATALTWSPNGDLIVACRRTLFRLSR